jgi:hypothetical protein
LPVSKQNPDAGKCFVYQSGKKVYIDPPF